VNGKALFSWCEVKREIEGRITYAPRPDAAPEVEREVLAAVYGFVLDHHATKKAAGRSGQDDAKEAYDVRARSILP
jgi:hypothetical protein